MRFGALLVAWLLAGAATGCKGQQQPAQAAEADPGEVEELSKEEQDLLARRDALLKSRREINDKRATLAEQRAELTAAGGDTTEIDKQETELLDTEKKLTDEAEQVFAKMEELATRQASIAAGSEVTAREAALAAREKTLATREARVADREGALSRREEALASKWKDSCVVGTPTTTIVQTEAKGSKYSKKDVEPLLRKARREMSSKGILSSDLPGHASRLEKEATTAMAKGDYGSARFAADQLFETIKAIRIDKTFVSTKWARLNRTMKGQRLTPEQEQLLSQAASSIADGKFAAANKQLNRLYASQ